LVEEQCLLRNRYKLRSMIKVFGDYVFAKLPIGFGEQLVFVPHLIDNL